MKTNRVFINPRFSDYYYEYLDLFRYYWSNFRNYTLFKVFHFSNVYVVGRCYGGCEEGGWWYDIKIPIKSDLTRFCDKIGTCIPIFFNICQERIRNWQLNKYSEYGDTKHDRYSVLGTGDIEVYQESYIPQVYPKYRPRYQ